MGVVMRVLRAPAKAEGVIINFGRTFVSWQLPEAASLCHILLKNIFKSALEKIGVRNLP